MSGTKEPIGRAPDHPWVTMIGIFRHGSDEPPGFLEEVLEASGRPFRVFDLWEDGAVPYRQLSHLIVLGGEMSVNDEAGYPFLAEEKRIIREMIAASRPVLGICLGAQMIASACGARVFRCEKEVGWRPVRWTETLPGVPRETVVFQWHDESFDLPPGARLICRGERVENQGFIMGSALGVQFHIEVTRAMVRAWTTGRDGIAADTGRYIRESNRLCRCIAEHFIGGGKWPSKPS
ncbi:MAG TPA: type 1 glutamine amidotransferase [Methanoregulaceae archaeon]|nr:MAG: type 1 glutamine amidotransferase [Methanolinea sp.]HRT15660.1 type 1 glutamine amidotransferase [Methanoregulaceae archaeon]